MLRELGPTDFDGLSDLISARGSFLSVSPQSVLAHREVSLMAALNLLDTPGQGRIFGLFEEKAIHAAVFTLISPTHPCFYIQKAYTAPESRKDSLALLFEHLIARYEELGYGRFYTMYRKQDLEIYHRLWRTSKVLRNYVSYTDLEIEPNIRPKHSEYWELLFGRMLFKDTMFIRGFVDKRRDMFFNNEN
jgi:hypothetical protein